MNATDLKRYQNLIRHLKVPENRTKPNVANLRWLLANAWIENRDNPKLSQLLQVIKPYV